LREPVPQRSLEGRLRKVVGPTPRAQWRLRLAYALVGVIVLALAFLGYERFLGEDPSVEVRREFSDPGAAARWASERSQFEIPAFPGAGAGTLASVHAAKGWACFDYAVEVGTVHVFVSHGVAAKVGCHKIDTDSGAIYVQVGTPTIRFNRKGLLFVVSGGELDRNQSVAESVSALLGPDR
jgi:hypothetical protein